MRVLLQRVSKALCTVKHRVTGSIEQGYVLFVGFTTDDDTAKTQKAANRIANLRIFEDENGKMNLNIKQVEGSILSISQFTLYANTNEGNRPSFTASLKPDEALILYYAFNQQLRDLDIHVETGIFGEHMDIELINDGPVTLHLEF